MGPSGLCAVAEDRGGPGGEAPQRLGALCPDEDQVEARSVLAFSLVIGHNFMAADHGARSHAG